MNMLKLCLESASQQFTRHANSALLSGGAKVLMATVSLSMATATLTPTSAQAQVWAGQTAASQDSGAILPQSSAGRWGDLVGASLGRVIASSVGGNANSDLGRRLQDVMNGVSEEVGRNVGRRAAERPYIDSPSDSNGRLSPVGAVNQLRNGQTNVFTSDRGIAESAVINGRLLPAKPANMSYHQDNLDLLALKTVVAYDNVMKEYKLPRPNFERVNTLYSFASSNFELALRSAQSQGYDIQRWMPIRAALMQPVGSVPQGYIFDLSQPMVNRLDRQDGPGLRALESQQDRSMTELRSLNVDRKQSVVRSMPIENFGR